ncbi:MAG TPA: hypothetical protein VMW72_02190, partial [Sedimentisphaerales bacterium]|nr:hypothetical protein [Sedimentisphaerales bacterium]HUU15933.1 hypothetical protein [Sedimentisphaerales bacterium]
KASAQGILWTSDCEARYGARLTLLDNVVFFISNGVDIADSCHLYLPAPPCFLAKARTRVTQAQVWLHKCRQLGAYTD